MHLPRMKAVNILLLAASLAVAAFLLSLSPQLVSDSGSYTLGQIVRAPLYPFLLKVLSAAFGGAGLRAVTFFQTVSFLASTVFFTHALYTSGLCSKYVSFAVFFASCGLGGMTTNLILPETFCFTFCLLFFGVLVNGLKTSTFKYVLLPIAFLCILARQQFVWLLVPLILFAMHVAYTKRCHILFPVALAASLFLLPLFDIVTNNFNEYNVGIHANTNVRGIYLLSNALYIAPDSVKDIFQNDPKEYEFVEQLLQKADAMKMRWKFWGNGITDEGFYRDYYQGEAIALYNLLYFTGSSLGLYDSGSPNDPITFNNRSIIQFDSFCNHVSLKIIFANKTAYAKHIFRKVYNKILSFVFLATLLMVSAAIPLSRVLSPRNFLVVATTLGMFANYAMLCTMHIIIQRYSMHADFFFYIFIILFLLHATSQSPEPECT